MPAFLCLFAASPAAADAILAGTVTDAITGRPVAGATVEIKDGSTTIGSGSTDTEGIYRARFTPPTTSGLITMMALVTDTNHDPANHTFNINNGIPTGTVNNIALLPPGVTACVAQGSGHSVIVGRFLSPVGNPIGELPDQVANSLDRALNTRLGAEALSIDLIPTFESCPAANPKTPRLAAGFARALAADAYVGGDVASASGAFTVTTYVGEPYGLFSTPPTVISKNVDFGNATTIGGETNAAVLGAIAKGLATRDDCVTAIKVISAAEQLVATIPPYLVALRTDCETRTPNFRLAEPNP